MMVRGLTQENDGVVYFKSRLAILTESGSDPDPEIPWSVLPADPEMYFLELNVQVSLARSAMELGDPDEVSRIMNAIKPYWENYHLGGVQ